MTERGRREYAEALRERYASADKQERGRILDEYCRVTRCHRKAAIRRLRHGPRRSGQPPGRPRQYGAELLPMLERLWRASNFLSGKLLVAIVPALLRALRTHHGVVIPDHIGAALVAASPATLDRLLRPLRRRRPRQPRRLGTALSRVRAEVPLRTWSEWHGVAPGSLQGDLVLHCGESTAGFYLATLVAVDVATSWTELQPVWGLHHRRVTSAVHLIRERLPFPLRAWHSDNGSEFINDCLLSWCRLQRIQFTRGRPYRKNDQAWVEQRNGLVVRGLIGYDRYGSRAAFALLHRVYGLLRLQLNFFRPVRKLVSKQRVGAKVLKRYDAPRTPFQRVLAARILSPAQQDALEHQCRALDPITLARDIEHTLDLLWKLADTRPAPLEAARG